MTNDLSDAFGASGKSLAGILLPRTPAAPRPERPADTDTEPAPDQAPADRRRPATDTTKTPPKTAPADPPAAKAPQQRRRASTGTPRRSAASVEPADAPAAASYQISVYVLPQVLTTAAGRRDEEGLTNAEIAFDAIDENQHRLAGLVRERRTQPRPQSSLFPARTRRGRPGPSTVSTGEGRRVLWAFRATTAELQVIDRLVTSTGAESRSELVSVALEASLLR